MSDVSTIEWTDATWNPVTGCSRVSPGCANCYIERTPPFRMVGRRFEIVGQESTTGVTLHADRLEQPLRWRKPRRVFVCSLADLFHDDVPDSFIASVFRAMGLSPAHTFQVLTKRPERALEFLRDRRWRQFGHSPHMGGAPCFPIIPGDHRVDDIPLPNVWLGVSIENARYTWRADVLREIPAAVRFISAEPLLGSLVDVPAIRSSGYDTMAKPLDLTGIDWVIIGGESGPGARPFHLEHAREIIRACRNATTCRHGLDLTTACYCQECEAEGFEHERPAVFVKQLGASPLATWEVDGHPCSCRQFGIRDRKGGDIEEWPDDLRIREFPADRRAAMTA